MGIIEDMAKECGIDKVKVYNEPLFYGIAFDEENDELMIDKSFQNLCQTIIEKYPELKNGLRYTVLHEKAHREQKGKMSSKPLQYKQSQANLYASNEIIDPLRDIAYSQFLDVAFMHRERGWLGSINDQGMSIRAMKKHIEDELKINYPWLRENASKVIKKNFMKKVEEFNNKGKS